MKSIFPALSFLLGTVHARSWSLDGCTSSITSNERFTSMVWYVPDTGELCDKRLCGHTNPTLNDTAQPAYTGTATYEITNPAAKRTGDGLGSGIGARDPGPISMFTMTTFTCGGPSTTTPVPGATATLTSPDASSTPATKTSTDGWTDPSPPFYPPPWAKTHSRHAGVTGSITITSPRPTSTNTSSPTVMPSGPWWGNTTRTTPFSSPPCSTTIISATTIISSNQTANDDLDTAGASRVRAGLWYLWAFAALML